MSSSPLSRFKGPCFILYKPAKLTPESAREIEKIPGMVQLGNLRELDYDTDLNGLKALSEDTADGLRGFSGPMFELAAFNS